MKILKIITHPVLLVVSFSFIIISGEKMSWPYVFAVLLGLTQLYLHSILGIIGIMSLLINSYSTKSPIRKHIIYFIASCLLILSLIAFFRVDTEHQNWDTFKDPISKFTLELFGLLVLIFLIKQIVSIIRLLSEKGDHHLSLKKV